MHPTLSADQCTCPACKFILGQLPHASSAFVHHIINHRGEHDDVAPQRLFIILLTSEYGDVRTATRESNRLYTTSSKYLELASAYNSRLRGANWKCTHNDERD